MRSPNTASFGAAGELHSFEGQARPGSAGGGRGVGGRGGGRRGGGDHGDDDSPMRRLWNLLVQLTGLQNRQAEGLARLESRVAELEVANAARREKVRAWIAAGVEERAKRARREAEAARDASH